MLLESEGYRVKFKEKLANLDREIVAFANASGGSILVGVNDNGEPIGVQITNALKSKVTDIARNCDSSIKVTLVAHPKNKILEIQIAEGPDKPYRCKAGFFLRTGPSSQKLKRNEIVALINHSGKIRLDKTLSTFLKTCGITTKLPAEDVLLSLNAAEIKGKKLLLTNAAILFFAKNPQQFFPENYITAVQYKTRGRLSIIDKKEITGTIPEQIEGTMTFLLRHMNVEARIKPSTQGSLTTRQDIYDYPLVALREAIINAVTHRNYHYDGSHIYIHMYSDHIDIESPGSLHHGLTIENLGKRSIRRNRLIADLLHRAQYIERAGSGFDRMKHALSKNNNPPLAVSATNFFNLRFYIRMKEKMLEDLTERQVKLYHLLQERESITKKEVAIALDISEDTALRELNRLIKLNLLKKWALGKRLGI